MIPTPFADLTDVTLADEDTNSILTDSLVTNASCATWWPNLQLMQVAPPGDQFRNQFKWCQVMVEWKSDNSNLSEIQI